jgi:hypothetical protein
MPTSISEQCSDPPVTVTAILTGECDHISHKTFFVSTPCWTFPLRGPVLTQNTTGSAL